jgi:hypothetical protein
MLIRKYANHKKLTLVFLVNMTLEKVKNPHGENQLESKFIMEFIEKNSTARKMG